MRGHQKVGQHVHELDRSPEEQEDVFLDGSGTHRLPTWSLRPLLQNGMIVEREGDSVRYLQPHHERPQDLLACYFHVVLSSARALTINRVITRSRCSLSFAEPSFDPCHSAFSGDTVLCCAFANMSTCRRRNTALLDSKRAIIQRATVKIIFISTCAHDWCIKERI